MVSKKTANVLKNKVLNYFAKDKRKLGYKVSSYQSFIEDFVGEFNFGSLTLEDDKVPPEG